MATRAKFGIFPKVLVFALCISLLPLGGIVFVAYRDMVGIGDLLIDQGTARLEDLGARTIENKAKDVARQLEVYVQAHALMTAKDLQEDESFRDLAVQPVGETGYTAVQDARSAVNLFHKNPKIVNMDLHKLAAKLPAFWEIMEKSLGGRESSGYYDWTDADGKTRKKFMYIVPLNVSTADGVQMGVAATTYLDEFSQPMVQLETTVSGLMQEKLHFLYVLIGVTIIVVSSLSFLLARTISRPILYLAGVADQISTGKLGTKIEMSRGDEIGTLIDSIRRMQRSLALAIKKLRERQLRVATG
jgi:methyl-accepting chemotaxis protein